MESLKRESVANLSPRGILPEFVLRRACESVAYHDGGERRGVKNALLAMLDRTVSLE